jgi:predicted Zn-dependent protease
VACLGGSFGCPAEASLRPELAAASTSPIALSDALEALIAEGTDTKTDRQAAYDAVSTMPSASAEDLFAKAAIAGRLAEIKGAMALIGPDSPVSLVAEAEEHALKSRKLDPSFRRNAALRLLGSLYVLAPANLLEGGTSEDGIEILESLVKSDPDLLQNHLRLAEAYVALGDKDSARGPLCKVLGGLQGLRGDEVKLARSLEKDVGDLRCEAAPVPAPLGG